MDATAYEDQQMETNKNGSGSRLVLATMRRDRICPANERDLNGR